MSVTIDQKPADIEKVTATSPLDPAYNATLEPYTSVHRIILGVHNGDRQLGVINLTTEDARAFFEAGLQLVDQSEGQQ